MPLSITTNLLASDIKAIASLKMGIVYALKGFAHDEIVLKIEQNLPQAYKQAGKVVKVIDPTAKAFVLSETERHELIQYCKNIVVSEDFFGSIEGTHNSPYSQDCIESAREILKELAKGYTAVKMQKLNVTHLEAALNERYEKQNKQPLRDLCKILVSMGGLGRLGEIMAADAFIGNSDRFSYQYGVARNPKFGGITIVLKVLNNPGNLMWTMNGGGSSLSMLDYVDSGSSFRNWAPLNEGSEQWPARYMFDKSGRLECAEKVASDLETIFSPNRGMFSRSKLGKGAPDAIAQGIYKGLTTILRELNEKVKSPNCNKGLQERYVLLKSKLR